MYTNKNSTVDIMDQIEGFDIFNSQFLVKLDLLDCESKVVDKNEKRLDLLTNQYYNDWNNYGILGIKNRIIKQDTLVIGSKLLIPSVQQINELY